MTLQTVFNKVRRLTNTSSASLPDSRLLDLANEIYLEIQRELAMNEIEVMGDVYETTIFAGQTDYQLPDDVLAILRLEVNYDDINDPQKWKKVDFTDLGNLPYEWYQLVNSQPKSKPLVDLFGNSLWLFPAPTQSQPNGLRMWYIVKQPDFTSASDELHPIMAKYWDVLAYGMAWSYLEEIGHPLAQRRFELYNLKLGKMISDLKVEVIEPVKIDNPNYFRGGWM